MTFNGLHGVISQEIVLRKLCFPPAFMLVACSAYFFDPEDGGDVSPKHRMTLKGLHGVISQKIVLYRTTIYPDLFSV
jgi:hypothetical protein